MTTQNLVSSLYQQGFSLRRLDGARLEVRPKSRLTDPLRAAIREHKAAILALLTSPLSWPESDVRLFTDERLRRLVSEKYQQHVALQVRLGSCPYCQGPCCWKAPTGWVCALAPVIPNPSPQYPSQEQTPLPLQPELWLVSPDAKEMT